MPFWFLIAGAFAGFVWWVGRNSPDTPTEKNSRPVSHNTAQSAGFGLGALGVMLLLRLGPWRAWALMSSAMAAMPFVARALQWQSKNPHPNQAPPHRAPQLTKQEAAQLLDVVPNATREEIETAYRKLMARVHPDTGGNAYLAQRVNEARDRLLN